MDDLLRRQREFLKSRFHLCDFSQTDQARGMAAPPVQAPVPAGAETVALPPKETFSRFAHTSLLAAVRNRRSRRRFGEAPLDLEELGFLLWATQGIERLFDASTAWRTVPSAGCRHPLETHLCALRIEGVSSGIYRYLPVDHQLLYERAVPDLPDRLVDAALGQSFVGRAAVVFVWTAVPRRMEWRYDGAAYKLIALDAGHVCQNLYLACEAVGVSTCAVAAYHQDAMDTLIGVDGDEEFTVYLAPVGKR